MTDDDALREDRSGWRLSQAGRSIVSFRNQPKDPAASRNIKDMIIKINDIPVGPRPVWETGTIHEEQREEDPEDATDIGSGITASESPRIESLIFEEK